MADRRTDNDTRTRLDELEERYDSRLKTLTNGIVAGAVTIVLSWVLAFWGLEDQQQRIQQSRVDAIAATCEATNREHRAIRRYVSARARSRKARRDVAASFPIVASCTRYARRVADTRD